MGATTAPLSIETFRAWLESRPDEERVEVSVSLLSGKGWTERRLTSLDDELVLDDFGLRCTLADLYRGTALQSRAHR